MSEPYWTRADEAENDVLLDELVAGYFAHRESCAERPCSHLQVGIEVLLEWRRRRMLRSRATWLRARQMVRDEELAA